MTFRTIRWSVVLEAGDGLRAALETLCETYWYPLYAFARRRGRDEHAAQDAVQSFFAHLLEKHALGAADRTRGRFRSFLLTSFRNHLAHDAERAAAWKRGGRATIVSLDPPGAEARYRREPVHEATPERLFDRDWALAVLATALETLRASYRARGKEDQFDALKGRLVGEAADGPADGAERVAVHRLRQRYGDALRAVVRDTLPDEADPEAEIRALFSALSPL